METLNVRSYSWYAANLSWAFAMESLLKAFESLGHNVCVISTNGFSNNSFGKPDKLLKSILSAQQFKSGKDVNIDLTYTIFPNLPDRFLPNSINKCVIYNYETHYFPPEWKRYYHLADYFFPSSNFSAEVFLLNGIPKEKTFVIPHGIDTNQFNPNIPPAKLNTNKKFKFLSICAPHARKNLDILLESYCHAFTAKDDVCLVLKTKIYKHSDGIHSAKNPNGRKGFEIVLGDIFKDLSKKYGANMPEIEIIQGHIDNPASLYNACHCHITTTGAEGFFLPGLEAQACNLINIAPRYSGHLDFLNDSNSLLIDTSLRLAKPTEQYWGFNSRAKIGNPSKKHTAELMQKAFKEYDILMPKFKPNMEKIVKEYSWENAAQKIIDVVNKKEEPYKSGTYKGIF